MRPMVRHERSQSLTRFPTFFHTRDGRRLYVRLIQESDTALLMDLFERLSPESRRRRFHTAVDHLPRALIEAEADRLADVDNHTIGGAVLALERVDDVERIVGVVRLMRPADDLLAPDVEAGIVVRDDYHGQGVAKVLLRCMVLLAQRMNAETIVAEIEADNHPAIRAFRSLALPTTSSTSHGETVLRIAVPSTTTT